MSTNHQADDLVEVTNYFSGGDRKRAEILAQPEACQQCTCYSCVCGCEKSCSSENGGYQANWQDADRGSINCEY